jgi:putative transposase
MEEQPILAIPSCRTQTYNYKSPILPKQPPQILAGLTYHNPWWHQEEVRFVDSPGRFRSMPRRLRIQFPGAIYHVMSRGNVRQDIVDDDHDRQQFLELLAAQAARSRWEVISFVLMTNHFHLLVRAPIANLAAGMQRILSAHAKGIAARHQRPGHLFQGRYKAELIEDESDYWTVSRYIQLNPGRAHLVARPEDWAWSSFPGYLLPARRLSWVGNERLW